MAAVGRRLEVLLHRVAGSEQCTTVSTPARCTAAAVASAMWIGQDPDAASTSSATRCIVLVQMTIASAPAVTRSWRRRPEPRRPLPVAGFLVRLDIGEVEGPDQQIYGRHCAEPVADDPVDVAFVFDRGLHDMPPNSPGAVSWANYAAVPP